MGSNAKVDFDSIPTVLFFSLLSFCLSFRPNIRAASFCLFVTSELRGAGIGIVTDKIDFLGGATGVGNAAHTS